MNDLGAFVCFACLEERGDSKEKSDYQLLTRLTLGVSYRYMLVMAAFRFYENVQSH